MQILLDKLGLGEGAGAIALWLGLGIILLIIVVSFGGWLLRTLRPSLNMGGQGRAGRPQRLAITDAFNLDREGRKLVIIRRDNVEHLLLIGGVNDIVIESNIIKGERALRGRAADGDVPLLPEMQAGGSEQQRPSEGTRPQAPNGTGTPVTVSIPAPSITMPPQTNNNSAPLVQASNAPQLRVPAALATPPMRPNAAPAPQDLRALEGMTARRDAPLAPPPSLQTMGIPQEGPNAGGNMKTSTRQAPSAPPPPSVKVESPKLSPQPASSFEDEYERALASAPLPQGQKPPSAPQPPAGVKPLVNAAPMPPPAGAKNAAAPSALANPAQASPAPAAVPARQEPMSEMARRLNEVLQRPINNGGNAQSVPPAPAPAAAPGAPLPPNQPAKKPADAPPQDQDMDMLEEEMARLLGRVGPPPGRS